MMNEWIIRIIIALMAFYVGYYSCWNIRVRERKEKDRVRFLEKKASNTIALDLAKKRFKDKKNGKSKRSLEKNRQV